MDDTLDKGGITIARNNLTVEYISQICAALNLVRTPAAKPEPRPDLSSAPLIINPHAASSSSAAPSSSSATAPAPVAAASSSSSATAPATAANTAPNGIQQESLEMRRKRFLDGFDARQKAKAQAEAEAQAQLRM